MSEFQRGQRMWPDLHLPGSCSSEAPEGWAWVSPFPAGAPGATHPSPFSRPGWLGWSHSEGAPSMSHVVLPPAAQFFVLLAGSFVTGRLSGVGHGVGVGETACRAGGSLSQLCNTRQPGSTEALRRHLLEEVPAGCQWGWGGISKELCIYMCTHMCACVLLCVHTYKYMHTCVNMCAHRALQGVHV